MMLPSLARAGVDLRFEEPPREPSRPAEQRAWIEGDALVATDARGQRQTLDEDFGPDAQLACSDTHVVAQTWSFEQPRLFDLRIASEIEFPAFELPVIDAALIGELLVVRLYCDRDGAAPQEEIEQEPDDLQIVIVGYDLAAQQERWRRQRDWDGAEVERAVVTQSHFYEQRNWSGPFWSIRARDGRALEVNEQCASVQGVLQAGLLFARSTFGLALWDEERGEVTAHIVCDGAEHPSVTVLDEDHLLVHSARATTLLRADTREVLAANTHDVNVNQFVLGSERHRVGERWSVVVHCQHPLSLGPARSEDAARWVKPTTRSLVKITPFQAQLSAIEAEALRIDVDAERWNTISLVLEDDASQSVHAARERLVARGVIGASFDPHAFSVDSTLAPDDWRWWMKFDSDPFAKLVWGTLAHDEARVIAAVALVDEANARLRVIDPGHRAIALAFCTQSSRLENRLPAGPSAADRLLSDALVTARFDPNAPGPQFGPFERWRRAQALWTIAVERGLTIAPGANAALSGRSFSELRSPYEPLLALRSLGFEPRLVDLSKLYVSLTVFERLGSVARS